MDYELSTLVTVEEMMELLNIGKNTTYSLLENGKVKAFMIGNMWKIPMESMNNYIHDKIYGKV
jgi:excisionase family DNA binding protein